MLTVLLISLIGAALLVAGLLLFIIIKIENMKFQDFEAQINAKLDALADAIAEETSQVTAAIQELRDLIEAGQGTPEQYLAILSRVDAKIEAVNNIYVPEEEDDEDEDDGDGDGDGEEDED
jgi:hypothetical protein